MSKLMRHLLPSRLSRISPMEKISPHTVTRLPSGSSSCSASGTSRIAPPYSTAAPRRSMGSPSAARGGTRGVRGADGALYCGFSGGGACLLAFSCAKSASSATLRCISIYRSSCSFTVSSPQSVTCMRRSKRRKMRSQSCPSARVAARTLLPPCASVTVSALPSIA